MENNGCEDYEAKPDFRCELVRESEDSAMSETEPGN